MELVVSQEGVVGDFTNNRFGGEIDNQLAVPTCTERPIAHQRVRTEGSRTWPDDSLGLCLPCTRQHHFHNHPQSLGWVPGKLQIGQAHAVDDHLVGADIVRRFEAFRAAIGNEIVLIDTIATHT